MKVLFTYLYSPGNIVWNHTKWIERETYSGIIRVGKTGRNHTKCIERSDIVVAGCPYPKPTQNHTKWIERFFQSSSICARHDLESHKVD